MLSLAWPNPAHARPTLPAVVLAGSQAAPVTLRVRSVSKTFSGRSGPVVALEDINLEVPPGDFVGLVGPSGCGKSTLLNLIAGLEQPSRGQVLLGTQAIVGPGADRVVMFQESALFPWLSVRDNVAFGLRMAGMARCERLHVAAHYLELVGLGAFERAWVHELSGGMKERVALARALALRPSVLLMDEPFAALDAQTRDRLLLEVQRIWQETGQTIIFVTHNVREAAVLANRVLVLGARPGRITAEIPVTAARPRQLKNVELLSVANRIADQLEQASAAPDESAIEDLVAIGGRRGRVR